MFTQKCFIRKDTDNIDDKLHEWTGKLGGIILEPDGEHVLTVFYPDVCKWQVINRYNEHELDKYFIDLNFVDCGTNEDLFLALAALRDDSDYMQYFTNGKDFILCDREDWIDMYSVLCSGAYTTSELDKFHKSTTQELIEHFKDK